MSTEVIPHAAAAASVGIWFADEIFASNRAALSRQLSVYLGSRVDAIFERAGEKALAAAIDPNPIRPGLLARMIMDCSFSADDPEITEWWANLLVDAAIAGSNRHAVFSDIMALLGPVEAVCLKEFVESFSFGSERGHFRSQNNLSSSVEVMLEGAAAHWLGDAPFTTETIFQLRNNMLRGEVPWPIRPISWSFPFKSESGEVTRSNMLNPWHAENMTSIGILEKVGIFQTIKATIPAYGFSSWVKAIAMTPLGFEFYGACLGPVDRENAG